MILGVQENWKDRRMSRIFLKQVLLLNCLKKKLMNFVKIGEKLSEFKLKFELTRFSKVLTIGGGIGHPFFHEKTIN